MPARTRAGHRHAGPARGRARLRHHRSGSSYVQMYGGLMDRRNLLLVDQRGTGSSEPIRCPRMQNMTQPFNVAAGRCGKSLGRPRGRLLDGALGRRPGRRPRGARARQRRRVRRLLRHVLRAGVRRAGTPTWSAASPLDASYPTYGESGWFTTSPPTARRSFHLACQRSPDCRRGGRPFSGAIRAGARPRSATSRGAAGRTTPTAGRCGCRSTPSTLVDVVFYAALHAGVLPRADRCPALRAARRPRPPPPAGRRGRPEAAPTPDPRGSTAAGSRPRCRATTTRTSTT